MRETAKIVRQLSIFFLHGDVTAPAYAWLAESVIAASDAYEHDDLLAEFADHLASYSQTGGIGLFGDAELRRRAERLIKALNVAASVHTTGSK